MAQHEVQLVATKGIFKGLAKQNMLFHQCIGELIDNSIASRQPNIKFRVEIIFERIDENKVAVYVVDNGKGMSLSTLKEALQLGKVPDEGSDRLHEHGFGLKNSLATLTRGEGYWKIWTTKNQNNIFSVKGPFGPSMIVEDNDNFPTKDFLPSEISTLVYVETTIDYIRTVQGRGGPTKDLARLRIWLLEHLGVFYRGYLAQDRETFENEGAIIVSIGTDRKRVGPIHVPLGNSDIKYFKVELGGETYQIEYEYGTLDEVKRDNLVNGDKSKYYYLKNMSTQGIDIRLGKRVLATRMLEDIWTTEDGSSQLNRHNNYNDFVGELRIPDLPRGVLSTVNNKTDFNLDDPDWSKIFNILNEYKPPKKVRQFTEKSLQNKWLKMLKATNPNEIISDEKHVWPSGVRIDVYHKKENGNTIIYEFKVGNAQPIHLYQLMMYWDGLEIKENETPKEGILLAEDYSTTMEEMVAIINSELTTASGGKYNLKIEKHSDKNLKQN